MTKERVYIIDEPADWEAIQRRVFEEMAITGTARVQVDGSRAHALRMSYRFFGDGLSAPRDWRSGPVEQTERERFAEMCFGPEPPKPKRRAHRVWNLKLWSPEELSKIYPRLRR